MKSEIPTKPLKLPIPKKQQELINRLEIIDEKLKNHYEFSTISKEKWQKDYEPLLTKILDEKLFDNDYVIIEDCFNTIEQDLRLKEDTLINQLKTLIYKDYGILPYKPVDI